MTSTELQPAGATAKAPELTASHLSNLISTFQSSPTQGMRLLDTLGFGRLEMIRMIEDSGQTLGIPVPGGQTMNFSGPALGQQLRQGLVRLDENKNIIGFLMRGQTLHEMKRLDDQRHQGFAVGRKGWEEYSRGMLETVSYTQAFNSLRWWEVCVPRFEELGLDHVTFVQKAKIALSVVEKLIPIFSSDTMDKRGRKYIAEEILAGRLRKNNDFIAVAENEAITHATAIMDRMAEASLDEMDMYRQLGLVKLGYLAKFMLTAQISPDALGELVRSVIGMTESTAKQVLAAHHGREVGFDDTNVGEAFDEAAAAVTDGEVDEHTELVIELGDESNGYLRILAVPKTIPVSLAAQLAGQKGVRFMRGEATLVLDRKSKKFVEIVHRDA